MEAHDHNHDSGEHGHELEPGDLVFFTHVEHGGVERSGGIVIAIDDGLLTLALPQGVETWNMRSTQFVNVWRVEHAPRALGSKEALAFSEERLAELRRRPLVLVHPDEDPGTSHH